MQDGYTTNTGETLDQHFAAKVLGYGLVLGVENGRVKYVDSMRLSTNKHDALRWPTPEYPADSSFIAPVWHATDTPQLAD